MLSLLRLYVNDHDHLAWRTLLQLRPNNIGSKAYSALYDLARGKGITFSDALFAVRDDPSLITRFGQKLSEEIASVQKILSTLASSKITNPLEIVRELAAHEISNETVRKQVVSVFEKTTSGGSPDELDELLRLINVAPDEQNEVEADAINIMSMHQAKGLTADATFVIAAEEEYLPGRAAGTAADDERRLLYVSLARARHFLYVTHCTRRTGPQRHSGSTSGKEERNLTPFLRGGIVQSRSGAEYLSGLA